MVSSYTASGGIALMALFVIGGSVGYGICKANLGVTNKYCIVAW